MWQWFLNIDPMYQALLATCFTWGLTALGAALVIFTKKVSHKFLDFSLGAAGGVMIAASFWSLLAPAIEMTEANEFYTSRGLVWFPAALGFLLGSLFLYATDKTLAHFRTRLSSLKSKQESWERSMLLFLAITIHNFPEGLAVGVAFGAAAVVGAASGIGSVEHLSIIGGAVALAIGIGLQNFPEGAAVSLPLRREGYSRAKALWYGQMSGIVEPVGGVLGVLAVTAMSSILPFALSFAAGAMIHVVIQELIPESQRNKNIHIATAGGISGFIIMMILDVGLG